ncbi:MAG: hypothetical protein GC159_19630 [Phycisphaera sp.]|nr:hypothetical protein [Phycisphaera sp.]
MYRRSTVFVGVAFGVISLVSLGGCGSRGPAVIVKNEPGPKGSRTDYDSPEEAKYCRMGNMYALAMVRGNWYAAYYLLSSDLKAKTTFDQFVKEREDELAKYGKPKRYSMVESAETDKNLLRGKMVDLAGKVNRLEREVMTAKARAAAGGVPDTVPYDTRLAAVASLITTDVSEIPNRIIVNGVRDRLTLHKLGFLNGALHLLFVDDHGEAKVGYVWTDWPEFMN